MSNEFNYEGLLKRKEIFSVLETDDNEHPVLIYNPNKEQRRLILNLILDNLKIGEEKISTDINGFDTIFKLLPELTNIPLQFDVDNLEHKKMVEEIVDDPSDLFLDINAELNKIINRQFYRYYDSLKELSKMPEDLRKEYIENLDKIASENEVKKEETHEEREIRELEERLAQIKSKKVGD